MPQTPQAPLQPLSSFVNDEPHAIRFVLTDIDDTLTNEGRLEPEAYEAMWQLHKHGLAVIPVTGRPAGWCELIARMWPVAAVIGENGALAFRYDEQNRRMIRVFAEPPETASQRQAALKELGARILAQVPGSAIASDQFSRLFDLAIDFAEDVGPLSGSAVDSIVAQFSAAGATAKVSSIHVNGWFGQHNKLTMARRLLAEQFRLDISVANELSACCYCGDSPNDEPLFEAFPNSFGVANIQKFRNSLSHPPRFVAAREGGHGFVEIAEAILKRNARSALLG
jgi:hypothetical protein